MANFFDQFDGAPKTIPPIVQIPGQQQNGNFFDQFDAPQPASTGPSTQGSFLPVSFDAAGNMSFDPNAGILGTIKRAVMAPGDVYKGNLDPNSEEGRQRAFDLATMISPVNPAIRAGEFTLPGELKSLTQPPKPPTAEALKNAATEQYNAVRATGATYPGEAVGGLARDTISGLNDDGLIAELAPQTHSILGKLSNPPPGSSVRIMDLDAARKIFGNIGNNFANPTEQRAAGMAREAIDNFIQEGTTQPPMAGPSATPRLSPPDGTGAIGPTAEAQAAQLLQDARGNYAAAARSEAITKAEQAGADQAGATNSGHNVGNALRQRLNRILNNPEQSRGYSQDEIDALRQVVRGSATTNTLRTASNKLAGGGGVASTILSGIGAGLGAHLGGPEWAAAGVAAPHIIGPAVRDLYNSAVGRQINDLDELIRMRSPLYRQMPQVPQNPIIQSMIMRGLLSAPSAEQQNSGLLGPIPNQ